ncbi:hypothetical protein BH11VER1_BH11VER1_38560 [soil metagenome]
MKTVPCIPLTRLCDPQPVRAHFFGRIVCPLILAMLLPVVTPECLAQTGPPFPQAPTTVTPALAEVPEGLPPGAEIANSNFDYVSWETFVALNWPADPKTCGPDLTKSILSGQGPVVWETYLADTDVFVDPKTSKPADWCGGSPGMTGLSSHALQLGKETGIKRFFGMISKFDPKTTESINGIQEVGGPLTDKNGRFVRYEVRMNQDEYNYIIKNDLWNKAGQAGQTINFPEGKTTYGPVGAMEIKAAWKVLGEGDDASKFYTIQGIVYNDAKGSPSPAKNPVTLGLVGLHILHKIRGQANWLWSTFEQNDNLTSFSYPAGKPNVQTAQKPYTELDATGKPINTPVNVTRINPIENPATEMNAGYQKLLAGSVWANYSLVATQWTGNLGGLPKPAYMANTVIETYTQGTSPPTDTPVAYPQSGYNPFAPASSSSCLKCHSVATTAQGTNADFSFLLGNAQ